MNEEYECINDKIHEIHIMRSELNIKEEYLQKRRSYLEKQIKN